LQNKAGALPNQLKGSKEKVYTTVENLINIQARGADKHPGPDAEKRKKNGNVQ
jgi:hypothetical protein